MKKEYCALCEKEIVGFDPNTHIGTVSRGSDYNSRKGATVNKFEVLVNDAICCCCWKKIRDVVLSLQPNKGKSCDCAHL